MGENNEHSFANESTERLSTLFGEIVGGVCSHLCYCNEQSCKSSLAIQHIVVSLSLSLSQSLSQYTIYMQYLPSTLTCFTLLCPFLLSKLFSPGINLFPLALVLVFTIHQFNLCLIKMTSEEKTQKFFDVSALTSSNIQILSSHTNGLFYVLPFPPTPFPESTDFIGLLL